MDVENRKEKTSSILKKLENCLSINKRIKTSSSKTNSGMYFKSKSWSSKVIKKPTTNQQMAPSGCFSVYVGPEKQRFVIKAESANHPLFKMLLEDAEMEYGFRNEGPLHLPCEVDLFCRVLAEMDCEKEFDDEHCSTGFRYGACSPFHPARRLGKSDMAKGCGSYGLLNPSR